MENINEDLCGLLVQIGLSGSEAKAYVALLELGSASAGNIAARAGVASSKIYEVLEKLSGKGLLRQVMEGGVKSFTAAEPELLAAYLEEREALLKRQKNLLGELVPLLKRITASSPKSEASVYRGMGGLRAAFYEPLPGLCAGEEVLATSAPHRSKKVDLFFVTYARELQRRGLKARILVNSSGSGESQYRKAPNIERRYTAESLPAAVNVIGTRVVIFPREAADPVLFIIDNADVAASFRAHFETSWNALSHSGKLRGKGKK